MMFHLKTNILTCLVIVTCFLKDGKCGVRNCNLIPLQISKSAQTESKIQYRDQTPCRSTTSYSIGNSEEEFLRAFVLCKENGMELATITSEEEQVALEKYMKGPDNDEVGTGANNRFWLGGTRLGSRNKNEFLWLTTGQHFHYTNWHPNQPDNYDNKEECLQLAYYSNDKYLWNDMRCDLKMKYVCQRTLECC
ncbi:C-type Lectin CRL-like [Sitophilus oryzae]|uniref:C-type Lectin CRL-like n=1 Tax=Sitophilus oryzae TaxID=7048 RepID=A0A6J2YA60_SITOR|nr:C-type Lectin CRL-like [Sitophilus oryzae]